MDNETIIVFLKNNNVKSNFEYRCRLAWYLNIPNYTGTEYQNLQLYTQLNEKTVVTLANIITVADNEPLNIDFHKKRLILKSLNKHSKQSFTAAAKLLGIGIKALKSYMEIYSISYNPIEKMYSTPIIPKK